MSTPATESQHQGLHPHVQGQPSRSQSTRSRPTATTSSSPTATGPPPHRSASTSHHHGHRRQGSSSTRPVQDVLPQQDYETSDVTRQYSKRSSSRDRDRDRPPPVSRGVDAKGAHRRSSSRSKNSPAHNDMAAGAAAAAVANNAALPPVMQAAAEARATGAKQRTTRTSIPTQSGKWILGKTIGAGSMGKVKLAKKEDGPEQVNLHLLLI